MDSTKLIYRTLIVLNIAMLWLLSLVMVFGAALSWAAANMALPQNESGNDMSKGTESTPLEFEIAPPQGEKN